MPHCIVMVEWVIKCEAALLLHVRLCHYKLYFARWLFTTEDGPCVCVLLSCTTPPDAFWSLWTPVLVRQGADGAEHNTICAHPHVPTQTGCPLTSLQCDLQTSCQAAGLGIHQSNLKWTKIASCLWRLGMFRTYIALLVSQVCATRLHCHVV